MRRRLQLHSTIPHSMSQTRSGRGSAASLSLRAMDGRRLDGSAHYLRSADLACSHWCSSVTARPDVYEAADPPRFEAPDREPLFAWCRCINDKFTTSCRAAISVVVRECRPVGD